MTPESPTRPGAGSHSLQRCRLLHALQAGVLELDLEGTVREVNPYGAALLGAPRESLLGRPVAALLAPLNELLRVTGALSGGGRGELERPRSGGEVDRFGYSITPIAAASEDRCEAGYAVLFRDISGLVKLRAERDRLLQLAVVGEVLPSVLHELRNPVAAVMAMVEVLVEDATGSLQTDLHAVLGELRRVSLGLQGIGGLGHSVRGERFEAIDEAVREACRVLETSAASKGIKLTVDVPFLPLLRLDRSVVRGVLFNLLRNAIDACSRGHRITVRAQLHERALTLEVDDDGPGMDPEVRARATELFFTTKERGSGLGLAICREAVERAGGTLQIDSHPGAGTRVSLRVPVS
jgi:signal transduction histidine kinase